MNGTEKLAYVRLGRGEIHRTEEVTSDILVDYDLWGNVLGVEILGFQSIEVDGHEVPWTGVRT